ncbi:DUF3626 domain-containing protein [Ferrimonas futtsuensis]|uniref:DUF3626 domain-containing protein n=1 Tax=Ferrimonas futtsuensis TaxID=364764 RepID=UPI00041C20DB|nr:DUF3626 domain-containing protein [Ferrimonas futtsuensis]
MEAYPALEAVERHARPRQAQARDRIAQVLAMSNRQPDEVERLKERLRLQGTVALHFHPDRPDPQGRPVIAGMAQRGSYLSQFDTGLSNGHLSPEPGGPRDNWESALFGHHYREGGERPKYGALDLVRGADGPSPRFGSCYFRLKPAVMARCSFSYRDSYRSPQERGTLNLMDDVLAAMLEQSFESDTALGWPARPPHLLDHLAQALSQPLKWQLEQPAVRSLDHYIEAQVHGEVRLDRDVESLVADDSYRGTDTGARMQRLANEGGFSLAWRSGPTLMASELPDDFRGPLLPELGLRAAADGMLNASALGQAAWRLHQDPQLWRDLGDESLARQGLKWLWHALVRFGHYQGMVLPRQSR